MVIGGWARRRSVDFGPFFLYAVVLFAFSALVSAVHVPGGTFIHSAVALAPYTYILALEGIVGRDRLDRPPAPGLGCRRRRRGSSSARPIGFAVLCTVVGSLRRPCRLGRARAERFRRSRRRSTRPVPPMTDRVMSIDAAGTRYWTGRGGVVLVNDPLDTIEEVARAYDIRWLVLDRATPSPRWRRSSSAASGRPGSARRCASTSPGRRWAHRPRRLPGVPDPGSALRRAWSRP